jgi:hypothetical protein
VGVTGIVALCINLGQTKKLPGHLDGADFFHLLDPLRGAPRPRTRRIEIKINGLIVENQQILPEIFLLTYLILNKIGG